MEGCREVWSAIGCEHQDPPEEAYGRVTDAERFRPLHSATLQLMGRLEADFDIERVEGYGLDEELESRVGLARASVRLSPADPESAPITVVFSDLPGLVVRLGRWNTEYFPDCGCDACGGSAEEEIEQADRVGQLRDRRRVSRGGAAPLGAGHWEAWALLALIAFSEDGATPLGAVHWDWLAGWEWLAGGGVQVVRHHAFRPFPHRRHPRAPDVRRTAPPGVGLEAVAP